MDFTKEEAETKEGEQVEVLDDSFSTSKGTKVAKGARGQVVWPHQNGKKVWTIKSGFTHRMPLPMTTTSLKT